MGASVIRFEVALAHVDAGRYEDLAFRLAVHSSETELFTVTRALAYVLWHEEGMHLSPGICHGDEPPLSILASDGRPRVWIDIGQPSPDRIQKAALSHGEVRLLTWRRPDEFRERLGARVSLMDRVQVYGLDEGMVRALADRLGRRNRWSLTVTEGRLYVESEGTTVEGDLRGP